VGRTFPSEPKSSGGDDEEEDEDKEEGEVTPPSHSLPLEDLLSLDDIFNKQTGISVGAHRPKWPGQRSDHRPVRHNSPALHWYLLTYRG
jgi:hypothetical protein